MNENFTHYSLFNSRVLNLPKEKRAQNGSDYTIADFVPIIDIADLLYQFWKLVNDDKTKRNCMWGKFCLHPEGNQISLEANEICLILYTLAGVKSQADELSAEGNPSAILAQKALKDK